MVQNKLITKNGVSGLNAMDKTMKYGMPLTFVFRVWGFRRAFFCIGVSGDSILSLACCPELANRGNSNASNIKLYNNSVCTECDYTIIKSSVIYSRAAWEPW